MTAYVENNPLTKLPTADPELGDRRSSTTVLSFAFASDDDNTPTPTTSLREDGVAVPAQAEPLSGQEARHWFFRQHQGHS